MKKLLNVWLIFLTIVLLLTGFLSWLLATNHGAKFVIGRVTQTIPVKIQINNVNGNLIGGLEIEEIDITLQSWEITAKRFYIRWNPLYLLGGWIGIRQIAVEELVVNDLFPEIRNSHDLTWPHVKGFVSWIKARIKLLHITNIIYKEAGREKLRIERLYGQFIWYLGGLNVRSFNFKMPFGIVDGSAGADFIKPNFSANFFIKSNQLYHSIDRYHFTLKLDASHHPAQISGPVTIIGMFQKNEQVKLSGNFGITKNSMYLDKIEVKEMGRPGVISLSASVNLSLPQRPYELNANVDSIGLLRNNESITKITGILQAKGDISGYNGSFSLRNIAESWKKISLEGELKGNARELKISAIKGSALNGSLNGELHASWSQSLKISGMLMARNLDPALITSDWPGNINADIIAELTFAGFDHPEGKIKANFLRSIVRKKPLTGNIYAQWEKGLFSITHGEFHGNGFDVTAQGIVQKKLQYNAKITDLGSLIPHAAGRLSASGWLRWNNKLWSGIAAVEGQAISVEKFKIDSAILNAQVNEKEDEVLKASMQARNVAYGPINLGSPTVNVDGKLKNHDILVLLKWPKSNGKIIANCGYHDGKWNGTLSKIEGTDVFAGTFSISKPVAFNISEARISMSPMILSGASGESVEISGDMSFHPLRGNFTLRWEKLKLARANQIYYGVKLDGLSSGSFEGQVFDKERLRLSGSGTSTFSIIKGPISLRGSSVSKLNCDEKGIRATLDAALTDGGKFQSQFNSNEQAYFRLPEFGNMKTTWHDIDAAILKPWIPQAIDIKGKLSGTIQGRLVKDSRFDAEGEANMTGSSFTWNGEGGIITSAAENVSLDFNWKDQAIKGNLDIRFPSYGKVKGTFNIPVSAHFPVKITKTGHINMHLSGEIRERGIISSTFPGFIEESRGQLAFDVTRAGTWEAPDVKGQIKLKDAAVYLPGTGTRVQEIAADVSFIENRLELASFTARSGTGKIQGSGTFWLKDFGLAKFRTKLEGNRFQAIYLPELQVYADPDLIIEGEGNKIVVKGKVLIPEALLRDSGNKTSVRTSDDVVIVDALKKEKKPLKTDIDIQTTVVMGNKVRIQLSGLDGRLEGSVYLSGRPPEKILGKGTLRIVNGKYNSYGIKLDVTRGNIVFDSKPIDLASLDIMAIRIFNPGKLDQVRAGVTVTGTPLSPLIKLYSDPPMTDTDILSYMVLGRPTKAGAETKQTALLLKSATTVLGISKSGGIQDQIQQLLGIDTIEVQEGSKSPFASSRTVTTTNSTLDNSLMTVGKYLSPDLYVSYGRSLFGDQYLVSARYNLAKRLELESKTGIETSVDLFYKIEFD